MRDLLERMLAGAEAEVAVLNQALGDLFEASRASNADDEHDPEGATVAFERAHLTATLTTTRRRVEELRQAIERHDRGTYGVCERCGKPIPPERLTARPDARTCVVCAITR